MPQLVNFDQELLAGLVFVQADKLWRLAVCRLAIWRLRRLQRRFGFDPWHAAAPFQCRPYKQAVADLVNDLSPSTVVDLGCGLGDIVSRIRAPHRVGYDIDPGVIRAARHLHDGSVQFVEGGARSITEPSIDVLIMVNWPHNVRPIELAALVRDLSVRTRYIVFDGIDPDAPASYRYRHDPSVFDGIATHVSTIRVADEPRAFYLLRVNA